MTKARISGQNNDVLFTIFDPPAMQLATEEIIAEKVFKCYLISFDYNYKESKIDLKF